MANDISPGYTRIRYHVGTHRHVLTFPCLPEGTLVPGSSNNVSVKAAAPEQWRVKVVEFANILKAVWNSTMGFDIAEFWSKPTPSDEAVFLEAQELGIAGTSGGTATIAGEGVLTFRTAHKGGLKLYFMETADANDLKIAAPYVGSAQLIAVNDYINGDGNWLVGRNGDYPLVGLNYTTKENDVLRDKYKLPS